MNSVATQHSLPNDEQNNEISLELCHHIDELRDKFTQLYKNLHNLPLYSWKEHYNNNDTIKLFFQYHKTENQDLVVFDRSQYLKKLSEKDYKIYTTKVIAAYLDISIEKYKAYINVKKISNAIWKETFKRNQIINSQANLNSAHTVYNENPWVDIDTLLEATKESVHRSIVDNKTQQRIQKAVEEREQIKKNNRDVNNNTWSSDKLVKIQTDEKELKIEKRKKILRMKIASRKVTVENQLWEMYKEFYTQLKRIIKISREKWYTNSRQEFIEDPRTKDFISATINKPSASSYIKKFIYNQDSDNNSAVSSKWQLKYFTFTNNGTKEEYIKQEHITEEVVDLFMFIVELEDLANKNT